MGNQLLQKLRSEGVRSKVRVTQAGKTIGGHLMTAGQLHRILTNPLYLGKVDFGGELHEGEHEAIIGRDQWDKVQARRAERHKCQIPRRPTDCLLTGKLYDIHWRRMHPDVLVRGDTRYRYYATELTREGKRQKLKVVRTGADEVEALALAALRTFLCDRPALSDALAALGSYDAALERSLKAGPVVAQRLGRLDPIALRPVFQALIRRAELGRERLRLILSCAEIARVLAWDGAGMYVAFQVPARHRDRIHIVDAAAAIVREARGIVLPLAPCEPALVCAPDPKLVALIAEARAAQAAVYADRQQTVTEVARVAGRGPAFFSRLVRLNYLAPDIVAAILDGDYPPTLSRGTLLSAALPLDWAQQRQMFGFPPVPDRGITHSVTARNHAPRQGGAEPICDVDNRCEGKTADQGSFAQAGTEMKE